VFEPDGRVIWLSFAVSLVPILLAYLAAGRLQKADRVRVPPGGIPSHALLNIGFFLGGLGGALFGIMVGPSLDMTPLAAVALSGPLVEELGKALLPLALFAAGRLPSRGEGLAVGLVVGGGFAAVESWLFVIESYASGGEDEWMTMVQLRLLFGTVIHMGASGLAGAILGEAWHDGRLRVRVGAPVAALLVALLIHGGWNITVASSARHQAWAIVALAIATLTLAAVAKVYADGVRAPAGDRTSASSS
jgi:RsiW-degrading membrane proteinase PrsW (M82 family)